MGGGPPAAAATLRGSGSGGIVRGPPARGCRHCGAPSGQPSAGRAAFFYYYCYDDDYDYFLVSPRKTDRPQAHFSPGPSRWEAVRSYRALPGDGNRERDERGDVRGWGGDSLQLGKVPGQGTGMPRGSRSVPRSGTTGFGRGVPGPPPGCPSAGTRERGGGAGRQRRRLLAEQRRDRVSVNYPPRVYGGGARGNFPRGRAGWAGGAGLC